MVFVSNISSVVKEANSVAGFGLDPQFAETLSELLSRCRAAGLDFRISQGLRTPQKQAEYYCKWVRRSPADIDAAARKIERDGAPWLASVFEVVSQHPATAKLADQPASGLRLGGLRRTAIAIATATWSRTEAILLTDSTPSKPSDSV